MNTFFCSTFGTPLGEFSVALEPAGDLVATAFGDRTRLQSRLGPCVLVEDHERAVTVRSQVLEYFAGRRKKFDLSLAPAGTAFQTRVWSTLREIPFGQTRSYGALARELRSSARAVGRANATNPICLIVPCHRVIGADGSLTGFAFGEEIKRQLLALEGGKHRSTYDRISHPGHPL